ncbi:polysaccharide biosynthesis tyrosine autokinase [Photobacterium sp.]|uniref:GumC family protein n=1 Tax=Photobacterium sp. TaxID=660 RepID=UPI00299EDF65|nr:polysaccharide biosynthesis tyrosine autokinase [Photobacterium sp.]MDX1301623.1 polysaccharide biosynthesis tyrosine autokinase [Photobacterium sp.]
MNISNSPASSPDTPWSRENEVSLRQYLSVVRRSGWRILLSAIAISLIVALLVSVMTPIYQATATVMIESRTAKVISIEEVYTPDSNSQEYYLTQYEILKSRPLVEQVIGDLDLLNNQQNNVSQSSIIDSGWSEWITSAGWPKIRDWIAQWTKIDLEPTDIEKTTDQMQFVVIDYLDNLKVKPVKNTQLIDVKFNSPDAELAAAVVNTHVEAYIQSIQEAKFSITQSAEKWLSRRVDSLKNNLEESERKLQAFREKEQLVDVEGLQHLPSLEINELTMKLAEAQRSLSMAKNDYQQVNRRGSVSSGDFDSNPAVLDDPLVQEFKNQLGAAQQKLTELEKRYGPNHPKMIAAQTNVKTINRNLSRQINSVIQGIKKKYEVAQANESGLKRTIEAAKEQYHTIGRKESELSSLQREVNANRELYNLFYNRLKETAETGYLQSANARIISPAVIPVTPIKPQKMLTIIIAFVLSVIAGVIVAFVRDALDNSLTNIADVELKLKYPLLGVVPLLRNHRKQQLISYSQNDAKARRFNEAIRSIHTGIAISAMTKPNKTLMITSTVSNEGKTKLAINLAYRCGALESVILIECDMRRPRLSKELKVQENTPGLAELIADTARLEECIVENENIHLITAGGRVADPLKLISSARFKNLLIKLTSQYDRVILDCPPVLPVSDAEVISTNADMVVYVVRAGTTQQSQIKNGLEKLARVKQQQIGIVVNGLDFRKAETYGDYSDYSDDLYEPLNAEK